MCLRIYLYGYEFRKLSDAFNLTGENFPPRYWKELLLEMKEKKYDQNKVGRDFHLSDFRGFSK